MNRRDAETQRRQGGLLLGEVRPGKFSHRPFEFLLLSLLLCVSAVTFSCSTQPSDLRTLAPAETLIYLETDDLGAALQPIVESKAFSEASAARPRLAPISGIKAAVAVTGFETSELEVTDEHSVGRIQPRFVAIIDLHVWNFQAVTFAETEIGDFLTDRFGEAKGGRSQKSQQAGGVWITWTGDEPRETAHAWVIDGFIYFGNDESAIDKCVAVRRGEADAISKNAKLPPRVPGSLASGYVSEDGVAQIAAIAGVTLATQSSDDEDARSAIADVLPQLIRGAVSDMAWTAMPAEGGYEDKLVFGGKQEIALVLAETFTAAEQPVGQAARAIPASAPSVTRYSLARPAIAWRGLLLTSQSMLDMFSARMLSEFASEMAEQYGIADPELFLSGVGGSIFTARIDPEGERSVVVASVINAENVRRSLARDSKPDASAPEGVEMLRAGDGSTATAFVQGLIISGDPEAVAASLAALGSGNLAADPQGLKPFSAPATAVTRSRDSTSAAVVAEVLSEKKDGAAYSSVSTTETRFTRTAIERRTVSDLGMIGWIIAQLASE